jgi:hypothetical protein
MTVMEQVMNEISVLYVWMGNRSYVVLQLVNVKNDFSSAQMECGQYVKIKYSLLLRPVMDWIIIVMEQLMTG